MSIRPFLLLGLASFLFDCATLSPLTADTCGNGVIDPGEDCDGFATTCGHRFASGIATAPKADCSLSCNTAGKTNACHFACDDTTPCPDGWGCSADRICRRPGGSFATPADAISSGADTLAAGDFDGDHRQDILVIGSQGQENSARARVVYFNDAAQLDSTYQFAAPLGSPTVRDLNRDGVDDVLFGVRTSFASVIGDAVTVGPPGGIGAATGQRNRSFVPAVFPSFTVPGGADGVPVLALPTVSTGSLQIFVVGRVHDASNAIVNAVTAYDGTGVAYQHRLPDDAKVTFAAAVGNISGHLDVEDACGDIVIAYQSSAGGAVEILSPCRYAGGKMTFASAEPYLTFAPQLDATTGIHLVDFDGDRIPEIVYYGSGLGQNTKTQMRVAQLSGDSFKFAATITLPELLKDVPLASGDLNADGKVDFVTPASILISTPEGDAGTDAGDAGAPGGGFGVLGSSYRTIASERASEWTGARAANLDGDGIPDLVAFIKGEPDVDFYAGQRGTALVHATISTEGAVSAVAAVDIDGDHLVDVAIAQQRSGTMEVNMAYGRSFGPPETPRTVGRIGGITSIDPLFAGTPNGLTIFTSQGDGGAGLPIGQLAVLSGDADRQPIAPILFTAAPADQRWQPLLVTSGTLSNDSKGIDFLALADLDAQSTAKNAGTARSLWFAQGQALSTTQDLTSNGAAFLGQISATNFSRKQSFSMGLGDLDGDGVDDIAIVVPSQPPALSISLSTAKKTTAGDTPIVALPVAYATVNRTTISVFDVDGDGHRDLVSLFAIDGKNRIVIALGNGTGAVGTPIVIPVDDAVSVAPVVTGGTAVGGTDARRRPLAIVTKSNELWLVDIPPGAANPSPRKLTGTFSNLTSVTAADVDGDGVEDLVVADDGAIRVLKQTAFGGSQ